MKDVLKYLRQTGGFTQAQVAAMLGVSRQSYSKYEKGSVLPSDQLVAKLAMLAEAAAAAQHEQEANDIPVF